MASRQFSNKEQQTFYYENAITAAGDTSVTFLTLPAGYYFIGIFGKHTNASADTKLKLEGYSDAAQTTTFAIPTVESIGGTPAYNSTLAINTGVGFSAFASASSLGVQKAYFLPYGAKLTYTKGAATVATIHLAFTKAQ